MKVGHIKGEEMLKDIIQETLDEQMKMKIKMTGSYHRVANMLHDTRGPHLSMDITDIHGENTS